MLKYRTQSRETELQKNRIENEHTMENCDQSSIMKYDL